MSLPVLLREIDRRFEVLHAKPEGTQTEPELEEMGFLVELSLTLRGQSGQIETLAKRLQGLVDALDESETETTPKIGKALQWARHALRATGPMALHTPVADAEAK